MDLLNNILSLIINIIHIIVIIFVVVVPFTNSNYLILLHIIIVPFIMLHWILNNNTCCLTVAEKYLREKTSGTEVNAEDCFTYKIIAPIYDFNKNHKAFETFIYLMTITVWLISIYKISWKISTGQIQKINDFVLI